MILLSVVCTLGVAIVYALIVGERKSRLIDRNLRRWRRCLCYMIGVEEEPPSDLPPKR